MITGFLSVAVDTLKTPAMKICIANSFATDGRFALIRSDDSRQALAALGGLTIEVDHMNGVEPVAGPRLDRRTKGIRAIASIVLVSYSK